MTLPRYLCQIKTRAFIHPGSVFKRLLGGCRLFVRYHDTIFDRMISFGADSFHLHEVFRFLERAILVSVSDNAIGIRCPYPRQGHQLFTTCSVDIDLSLFGGDQRLCP